MFHVKTLRVQVNGLRNKENYEVFVLIVEVPTCKMIEVVEKSALTVVDTIDCAFKV